MTTNIEQVREFEPYGSEINHIGLGLGIEHEQVQRAAKAQIMDFLPEVTKQLQGIWDQRDRNHAEITDTAFNKIKLPEVEKENFYTGLKPSLVEAPLFKWPSITVFCHNSKPSSFQADQYDTNDLSMGIWILCKIGPIKEENIHEDEGIKAEEELDSITQRLSDAVHICIKKDPCLGGVIAGNIEKPPVIDQEMPWSRKKEKGTGNIYIFQGKQMMYTVQKNSF